MSMYVYIFNRRTFYSEYPDILNGQYRETDFTIITAHLYICKICKICLFTCKRTNPIYSC